MLVRTPTAGWSDDGSLTGVEGHPLRRFPLRVWAQRFDDDVERGLRRAVEDWNTVFRDTLRTSVAAFDVIENQFAANVLITPALPAISGAAGSTIVGADRAGVIALPVRITIRESTALDGVSRETLFYHVIAHELGHALGLPHVPDPGSLMCCVKIGVDLNDPAARRVYLRTWQRPDVRSVRRQLAEQYFLFWSTGPL